MSFELSEGYIDLYVEGARFFTDMSKVKASMKSAHEAMIKLGDTARNMFLVGAAAMGYMVKKASDSQETISKFDAVFKEQAQSAAEFAQNLAGTINRSKYDLMGYMATLQDTFVPLGFARDEAARMSESVTALAEDLASFNNLRTEDVVAALQSALIGNTETVRKFGVVINEAALNQELLNMGISSGAKTASEQEKAVARLNIILRSTTDAQGDAERTSGSFANQLKGLKAKFDELSITVGQAMIPVLTNLISHISPVIQNMALWASVNGDAIVTLSKISLGIIAVTYIIPKIISGIMAVVNAVRAMIAVQTVLFSISGPAGWAALAGGVAIAAATLMGMDALFQNLTMKAEASAAANDKVAASLDNVANSSKAASAGVANFTKTAQKPYADPLAKLGEQADNLGLDQFQQAELELRKNNDWNDGAKFYLDHLRETITAKQKELDLAEKAKEVYENTLTPLEQHNKKIAELNELLEKKLITQETYNRAKEQANNELSEATRDREAEAKAQSAMQEAQSKARRVFDETRTALEKYNEKLAELNDLQKQGLIDQDTYDRAIKKAKEDYDKAAGIGDSGAIRMPSTSQLDRRISFESVGGAWSRLASALNTRDPNKEQLNEIRRQTEEQKKQTEQLREIAKNTGKSNMATVGE